MSSVIVTSVSEGVGAGADVVEVGADVVGVGVDVVGAAAVGVGADVGATVSDSSVGVGVGVEVGANVGVVVVNAGAGALVAGAGTLVAGAGAVDGALESVWLLATTPGTGWSRGKVDDDTFVVLLSLYAQSASTKPTRWLSLSKITSRSCMMLAPITGAHTTQHTPYSR